MHTPFSYAARVPRSPADHPTELVQIAEFIEFVARQATGTRQRRRLASAVDAPVTMAELTALRAVHAHEPINVGDLAERLALDRTTVSRNAARLEELGLVARTGDETDRRRSWLTLAPAGRAVLDRLQAVSLNDFDVATAGWSDDDRRALAGLLDRLRTGLSQLEFDPSGWAVRTSSPTSK